MYESTLKLAVNLYKLKFNFYKLDNQVNSLLD